MLQLEIKIKSSIFDRDRILILNPEYIQFDDKDLKEAKPTTIVKTEISGFRFGLKPIRGYYFHIGRIYCIDIRGNKDQFIKIRLKSVYGIRKKELTQKYSTIVKALYDYFIDEISLKYLNQFSNNEQFEIAGVNFNEEGVIFNKKIGLITWLDLGTRAYYHYYTLYSKQQPTQYKAFEFINDWNVAILYGVSRQILKNKNLWTE